MNTLHGIVAETGFRFTPVLIGEFILENGNSLTDDNLNI